jgi:hypothetical protein
MVKSLADFRQLVQQHYVDQVAGGTVQLQVVLSVRASCRHCAYLLCV